MNKYLEISCLTPRPVNATMLPDIVSYLVPKRIVFIERIFARTFVFNELFLLFHRMQKTIDI